MVDKKVTKVHKVRRVLMACQVFQEQWAHQVPQVITERKVLLVYQDQAENQACQAYQGPKVNVV